MPLSRRSLPSFLELRPAVSPGSWSARRNAPPAGTRKFSIAMINTGVIGGAPSVTRVTPPALLLAAFSKRERAGPAPRLPPPPPSPRSRRPRKPLHCPGRPWRRPAPIRVSVSALGAGALGGSQPVGQQGGAAHVAEVPAQAERRRGQAASGNDARREGRAAGTTRPGRHGAQRDHRRPAPAVGEATGDEARTRTCRPRASEITSDDAARARDGGGSCAAR